MRRRALVSGASGFIGTKVVSALVSRGWSTEPLRRKERIGEYATPTGSFDALIHLAFPADHAERVARPMDALTEAACGTAAVVRLAQRLEVPHLVLASSGKVYGAPARLPVVETAPVAPIEQLGRLKAVAEAVVAAGAVAGRLGVTSLRLFNVYGPGQRGSFLAPKLANAARSRERVFLGELDHRRDWVHVDDAVRAFLVVLDSPAHVSRFRPLNVGSSRSASARDLLALIQEATRVEIEWQIDPRLLRPEEPREECADVGALGKLGWRPEVSLERGLSDLVS